MKKQLLTSIFSNSISVLVFFLILSFFPKTNSMASITSRLASNALKRANIEASTLFICDVQEVFRPYIHNMPSVIHNSEFLNTVCNVLNIPTVITEHYAKAFGKTVSEITVHPTTKVYQKTFFSMMTPELKADLPATRNQVRILVSSSIDFPFTSDSL